MSGSSHDEPGDMPGMIERLDAGDPPASPEEAQARAPYEKLLGRIRDLDNIAPPAGWEDRATARWSRRRRAQWLVVGATSAIALAAVFLLHPCAATDPARLEIAVLTEPGSTYRGDAAIGQRLRARAHLDHDYVDLRIYLEARRIARCPGSAECQQNASVMEINWRLVEAGTYQIVMLSSDTSVPAGNGTLDSDLLAARNAGARTEVRRVAVSP